MDIFFAGLLLGLAMITPIGPQNIFLINQGFSVGMPRAWVAVGAAGVCDTVLIVLGGAGASAVLQSVPGLKTVLLVVGVGFLSYLGVQCFRTSTRGPDALATGGLPWTRVVARCASVSVLNPHSVLDVVGVLGVAIATQTPDDRPVFAAGTVSASWVWFIVLTSAASSLRRWLTPQRRQWIDWLSGSLLLLFAALFAIEAVRG
ncbi:MULTISPECIES: LysE/ArgO family amino acid transporter [Micromonospora]|uniref:LysE family transporter n=1 Tax=Micromonospora antibiotica TaxID=2807623 RepID=A0ABS3V4X0_9ACTN|nr:MULTISPECIES: LysE family transporter [Micromonospora]MBO4160661.1 LysE family transporter [Micromonospora antibiotica]MBW4700747.1 LysE family transporter [Micromonospora sp. RL09-050-HVF-A]